MRNLLFIRIKICGNKDIKLKRQICKGLQYEKYIPKFSDSKNTTIITSYDMLSMSSLMPLCLSCNSTMLLTNESSII